MDTVFVYGPGGPYPPIEEAARLFQEEKGVIVKVIKGPSEKWLPDARRNADIIYSGSQFMMQQFVWALDGVIDENTIVPLYLRPSGLLVRKGNPEDIHSFNHLTRPGIRIMVVEGAGQTGLWEDMAGKGGNMELVRAVRRNIVFQAKNSAQAIERWKSDTSIDVWITWNIWQIAHPDLFDFVPVSDRYVIFRGCDIALTRKGERNPYARGFFQFLTSDRVAPIFSRWGWITDEKGGIR